MSRIAIINSVLTGSTGKIARQLADLSLSKGHKVMLCVPKGRHNSFIKTDYELCMFGSRFSEDSHILLSRITGYNGCFSRAATRRLLKKLSKFKPDIIHLHNLHNSYINLPLLFKYIKKNNISAVWTLHDCWSFTGQCAYFTMAGCDKWKNGCHDCPSYRQYPSSYVDRTRTMWKKKRAWFCGVKSMTVVTPSQWLADLAAQSYLGEYPIKVINNGIDLSVFKPRESDFREKYGLGDKYILLGVAFGWGKRKGLDVFFELASRLGEEYRIVLVGAGNDIGGTFPSNITFIPKTQDQIELAEIYSAADLFLQPTKEENYPTVNMEALACGTPVLTFKTGGSPEMLDESCGSVVEYEDVDAMEREIHRICENKPYSEEACLKRSEGFDKNARFSEYVELYQSLSEDSVG